jgi:mannose-6-phosphate isomerase
MRFLCEGRFEMAAIKLQTLSVEKPWGRRQLGFGFADVADDKGAIGEIWFDAPPGVPHELMIKYLFTSERLSIQVHPNDVQAQAAGLAHGKEEAWLILDAAPDSTIAIGTVRSLSRSDLHDAALDGSIEQLVDWKPVAAGDVIYLPAGTIHAIGAGITLIEVQQNIDLTYRLYDYGRPRELHLDAGMSVSSGEPFVITPQDSPMVDGRQIVVQGGKFVVEKWTWTQKRALSVPSGHAGWFVPVAGGGTVDGQTWRSGECWHLCDDVTVVLDDGAEVIFAYFGPDPLSLFA